MSEYNKKPAYKAAHEAVSTLIRWTGDNPDRAGLVDTPDRVLRAFGTYFSGYQIDPHAMLAVSFEETDGYDDAIVLRDIIFHSHCEHHLAPIVGRVHIGYLPNKRVVGISKLGRVVEAYARRLQLQERMTAEIAHCLHDGIQARGVAVIVEAQHHCIAMRGIARHQSSMQTQTLTGIFTEDREARKEMLQRLTLSVVKGDQ